MPVTILYFAWVREAIGRDEETVEPPSDVTTLGELIPWLAGRSASHAEALGAVSRLRAAIDQRFAAMDASVIGAREIAIFPPVTGMTAVVRLQTEPIDVAAELDALEATGGGGVASFTGIVRGEGGLIALELEIYPGMTFAAMERICAEAATRWPLLGVTAIHRHGRLAPGDRIVFVGAAAAHRGEAIAAVSFLIDWLKTRAPFWKREHFDDGRSAWVEARSGDDDAAGRWDARD